jgi:hypothetical protein
MAARQHRAVERGRLPTTSPPFELLAPDEPDWLCDSLRYQFWQPADFATSFRQLGRFTPRQRETVASWWSVVAAVEGLAPRMYAAAFVRATEQHDSDQVRWSLLAMLGDELEHEQLFRLAMRQLAPGWPLHSQPKTTLSRYASPHLDQVDKVDKLDQEAERCWRGYRRALDRQGIGVVSGALLLDALVTGAAYEQWASGCAIPALATAFRHAAHDANRHQAVLRALAARDWPLLSAAQGSEAAAQVQATARLLSALLLDPDAGQPDPPGGPAGNQAANQAGNQAANQTTLGVPTAEQRQELLRTALLEVRDLQRRYHVPFQAIPDLAIPGTQRDPARVREGGGTHDPPGDRPWSLHPPRNAGAR